MPMRLEGSCRCCAISFSVDSHTPYPYQRCYCSICRKSAGGDRGFESGSLQRGVCCEPDPLDQGAELQLAGHRMTGSHSCTRLFAPL
jgi:hypothetical protein